MYQRRRAPVLLAVLVLVALVLITLDFRSGDTGPLERARTVASAVFSPVQDGLAALARPVVEAAGSLGNLFRLRAENEQLRERLEMERLGRRAVEDLERENRELRGLLAMAERRDLRGVVGRTIALGPSNYEWTITIDAGTADGVERDMAVINGDGLVGRVIQVGASSARVLLAIDPNFGGAAHVARLGEQGRISGRGSDLMRFLPLDPQAPVQIGDEIVTSSYQNGIFPPGIPIGAVEEVIDRAGLLRREALVRPFVDFTRLSSVLVVQHRPPEPLPPVPDAPAGGIPTAPAPTPSPAPATPAPTPSPAPTTPGPTPSPATPTPSPAASP